MQSRAQSPEKGSANGVNTRVRHADRNVIRFIRFNPCDPWIKNTFARGTARAAGNVSANESPPGRR